MRIVLADCDRCGEGAKECVQTVVKEFADTPEVYYPDYEFTNVCESCIGNMLAHEDQF